MMRRWGRRALPLVLVAVLGALAAGCGGGGDGSSASGGQQEFSSYESAMQSLGQQLGSAIQTAGNGNISAPAVKIVKNLQRVQVLLRKAAVKLEKITPPAEVSSAHKLLIKGVREYATELDSVIKTAKTGDTRTALSSIFTLKGLKDMQKASQSIEKAGFVIVTP